VSEIFLIVRGDGFGLCHAANQAIVESFETGLLTSTSLMAAGPWVTEAADFVHLNPHWEVGVELVLRCCTKGCRWGPVSGPSAVPSLVAPSGTFLAALPESAPPEQVFHELNAQVQRARLLGLEPAYLEYSGEDHVAVDSALQQLSEEMGVPARMMASHVRPLPLSEEAEKRRLPALREAFTALERGTYVWVTHPAQDSPETWALWHDYAIAEASHADHESVCSSELRALLDGIGIQRISFRQHLQARQNA
jgi:predicted glycoside hydrolase/deacetylase ChbG (UPF0249 family)